jgi:hypothetical protein
MMAQDYYAGSPADSFASVANTPAVVTLPAQPGLRYAVSRVLITYSGTPAAAGVLSIEDGAGNVIQRRHVPSAGPHTFSFDPPLAGSPNRALIVTLGAGGSGIVGYLNVFHGLHGLH